MRNKAFVLLPVIWINFMSCYAQQTPPAYYYASAAFSLEQAGYKPLADSLMDLSFQLLGNKNMQGRSYLQAAVQKEQLRKKKEARALLRAAVERGIDSTYILRRITEDRISDSIAWKRYIRSQYAEDRKTFYRNKNEKAVYMLMELHAMDQGIRKIIDAPIPGVDKACIAELAKNNVGIVYDYFYSYLQTNPFPSVDEVGYKEIDKLSNLCIHFGSELDTAYRFLDKVLLDAVYNRGYLPGYYAVFVDFHRRKSGLKDYYGNELFLVNEDDTWGYHPLENIAELDARRRAIGLSPLYFHALLWKVKLPENYVFSLDQYVADIRKEVRSMLRKK